MHSILEKIHLRVYAIQTAEEILLSEDRKFQENRIAIAIYHILLNHAVHAVVQYMPIH